MMAAELAWIAGWLDAVRLVRDDLTLPGAAPARE